MPRSPAFLGFFVSWEIHVTCVWVWFQRFWPRAAFIQYNKRIQLKRIDAVVSVVVDIHTPSVCWLTKCTRIAQLYCHIGKIAPSTSLKEKLAGKKRCNRGSHWAVGSKFNEKSPNVVSIIQLVSNAGPGIRIQIAKRALFIFYNPKNALCSDRYIECLKAFHCILWPLWNPKTYTMQCFLKSYVLLNSAPWGCEHRGIIVLYNQGLIKSFSLDDWEPVACVIGWHHCFCLFSCPRLGGSVWVVAVFPWLRWYFSVPRWCGNHPD